ncbi:MAG: OmpW family outer membrane protein [Halioglobus sp.]
MRKALTIALVVAMAGGGVAAQAYEQGDFIVRAGATTVDPDTDSDDITLPGITLEADVDDDTQLGILPVYMVTNNFGMELLLATPFEHDITAKGSGVSLDAGSTKQLPPTLSLQWYPRGGQSGWQPYIGVGLNYTVFFDEDTDKELDAALGAILGAEKVDLQLDDSFGLAGQVGIDYPLGEHWAINAAIWYIDIDTEAKIQTDAGNVEFDVDIDPWVYNLGIAYKF